MTQIAPITLDEALMRAKFGKFNIFLMFVCGAVLSCGFLETTSVNLILPIAQCELQLSNSDKGLLGTIGYFGIIASAHFWGFLADTRGRKKVIVPALLLSFVFTFLSSFAKNFWTMAVLRFLVGFCICVAQTVVYAFVGEFFSSKDRARAILITSFIYALFCLTLPLNGFLFINQNWTLDIPLLNLTFTPWRLYLIMNGVPSVISGIFLAFFIPESPKFVSSQGDDEKTLEILTKIHKINTGSENFDVPAILSENEVETKKSGNFFNFMWTQTRPFFSGSHARNLMTASYLQFGFCLACNGWWSWYPEILNKAFIWMDENPGGKATICEILDTFELNFEKIEDECLKKLQNSIFVNIVILQFIFISGWGLSALLVDRIGKLFCLLAISIPCGICSIVIMLIEAPEVAVYLYPVILAAGVNIATLNTSTVELFPTTMRAMAVSLSMMFGRIGSIVGSNTVGFMIKSFCKFMWLIPAVLLLSGSALMFTIPKIKEKKK